jgi:putative NADH-flavin reductase
MVRPLRTAATNQNLNGPISPLQQRRSLDSARENCALEATSFATHHRSRQYSVHDYAVAMIDEMEYPEHVQQRFTVRY